MKFLGSPSSGSIAGITFSHNRAGQYQRNRRSPVQPVGTGRRAFMRSAFGSASGFFASMTVPQQTAWTSFAASHPITDSLGQSIVLTGHQMSTSVNAQRINAGGTSTAGIPASTTTNPPGITSFTAVHAGAITLTLDGTGTMGDTILLAFSRPVSGGITFMKTFWQQSFVDAASATPIVLTVPYTTQFGSLTAGQRIFYKLTPVNADGWTGTPVINFITVT